MRFLGLELEDRVPDVKTVWVFRERLKELELVDVYLPGFMNSWRPWVMWPVPDR